MKGHWHYEIYAESTVSLVCSAVSSLIGGIKWNVCQNSVQRGSEKVEDGSLILQSILDQILCNFSTTQVAFHWL